MSKIRELIKQLPFIAECIDADRFSERNLMVFDREIEEVNSVFDYRETDKIQNRLAVLEIPADFVINQDVYEYGMDQLKIAMLSQDKVEGRISKDQEKELRMLIGIDITESPEINAIDEILPREDAVKDIWH